VERRIGNFVGLNLRSTFDELIQVFHNFWIASPGVSLGILLFIPQANRDSLSPTRSEECEFALKPCVFSQRRNCFVIDLLGECHRTGGLQTERYITSKHGQPPGFGLAKRGEEISDSLT